MINTWQFWVVVVIANMIGYWMGRGTAIAPIERRVSITEDDLIKMQGRCERLRENIAEMKNKMQPGTLPGLVYDLIDLDTVRSKEITELQKTTAELDQFLGTHIDIGTRHGKEIRELQDTVASFDRALATHIKEAPCPGRQ